MEVYWLLRSIHELSAAQIRDVVCTDAAVAIIRGEGVDRVERVVWIAGTQVDVDDTAQWSMQVTLETIRYTWIVLLIVFSFIKTADVISIVVYARVSTVRFQ